MRVDIITLFPEMFMVLAEYGITRRACERGLLQLVTWNPRDDAHDRHRTVDDRPYGGGPGMVMKAQPLCDTLKRVRAGVESWGRVIFLSPQGRPLNQAGVQALATMPHLILIAGRYEGVDERFIESQVDEEWSIGDYVLSGGELAVAVLIDAITRVLPGALGNDSSAQQDSFVDGLLDYPHYTRPEEFDGQRVPTVLLSGDHAAICRWRRREALGRTWLRRPDLLQRLHLDADQRALLNEFIQENEQQARSAGNDGRSPKSD